MATLDHNSSVELVRLVARHLGPLVDECVFLGGAVTPLLITDPGAPASRPTKDVDIIVDVGSRAQYAVLRAKLVERGFTEDMREGAPMCRWTVAGLTVDIMPCDPAVLGFSNRWYPGALASAEPYTVSDDVRIRLITPPFFIATKLEAFLGRGDRDFMASHDLEDVIAVVDGRSELLDEVAAAPADVRAFVSGTFRELLDNREFEDALPGHLPPDEASQARLGIVLGRMQRLAQLA